MKSKPKSRRKSENYVIAQILSAANIQQRKRKLLALHAVLGMLFAASRILEDYGKKDTAAWHALERAIKSVKSQCLPLLPPRS